MRDDRPSAILRVATTVIFTAILGVALYPRPSHAQQPRASVAADTQRVTLKVEGMYCASCEATVHTMLKRAPGVYSATVDVKHGTAAIAYNPNQTTPQKLVDVIDRLGYKATLPPAEKPKPGH